MPTMAGKCNTSLDNLSVTLCPSSQKILKKRLNNKALAKIFNGLLKYGAKEL